MRDPSATASRDDRLHPLLERLGFLEAANASLRVKLSDRRFVDQVQDAALREQLESAKAELSHQEESLANLCREFVAAARARDAAQAEASESLRTCREALSRCDSLKLELDAALAGKAEAESREAESLQELEASLCEGTSLSLRLQEALKARAEAEALAACRFSSLEVAGSELETLRLEAVRSREELAALEVRLAETARTRDEALSRRLDMEERIAALAKSQEEAQARADWQLKELRIAVDDRAALSFEAVRTRDAIASLEARLHDAALARDEAVRERDEARCEGDASRRILAAMQAIRTMEVPAPPRLEASAPAVESPVPAWGKILPALSRAVGAAFARLRQLPLAAVPEGPRAMIRLAAASLTQTSDMLKVLEEFYGEASAPPVPASAEGPISSALATWDAPLRRRRIVIQHQIDPGLPQVLLSEEPLRVAVFQVIRNAYEAMPSGGGLTVKLSRDPASGGVIALFSDTGPGFSKDVLPGLFVAFSGARPGHLGLGLSLARRVLRRFGGDVKAANSPQRGAQVSLLLVPAEEAPPLTRPQ